MKRLLPQKETGDIFLFQMEEQENSDENLLLALQSGALRIGAYRDFHPIPYPLIAFEHLSLYIQKHLSQSVAVCGSLL